MDGCYEGEFLFNCVKSKQCLDSSLMTGTGHSSKEEALKLLSLKCRIQRKEVKPSMSDSDYLSG